jgi:hypothetical protein
MTDRGLRKYFRVYNESYFDNKLLSSTIVEFGKTVKNSDGNYRSKENRIVINQDIMEHDVLVCICLLHEMAHAKLYLTAYCGGANNDDPHHGMLYQAELVRLFNAGAYDGLL